MIAVALNKKSAQKQKDKHCNNGFSQAVVPSKTEVKTLKQTPKHPKLRHLGNSQAEVFFIIRHHLRSPNGKSR